MVKKTTKPKVATKKKEVSRAEAIAKKYGNKMGFNAYKTAPILDVIPTGSVKLDIAMGVGGAPRGRIMEIAGLESTGKSTLTMNMIANAQKMGYVCAFIDAEFSFDPDWASKIGVDPDALLVYTPENLEVATQLTIDLVSEGVADFIVFDSIAALDVEAALEGEMGDSQMGKKPAMLSKWMRLLAHHVYNKGAWVILINQLRMKMNLMNKYEDKYTTTGGMGIGYHCSIRLRLTATKEADPKDKENIIGARIRARVNKNKVAPPFKKGEYVLSFETGQIDTFKEVAEILLEDAETWGITKGGSWYTIPGSLIGEQEDVRAQGMNGIYQYFEDAVVFNGIVDQIRRKYIKHEDAGSRSHTGEKGELNLDEDDESGEDEGFPEE